ncbi:hypothetical protein BX600DRAFT_443634 [Xylariales sp. PMI_506]|nr:hypothetical protein BX600DRAFT_443634 [Xylariales sp. PMI_506]
MRSFILPCLAALIRGSAGDGFISPKYESSSIGGRWDSDSTWALGSSQLIAFQIEWESYRIEFWQQSLAESSASLSSTLVYNQSVGEDLAQSFYWTTQTYELVLSDSPVFFFWMVNNENTTESMTSAFFNITVAAASTSSTSTGTATSSSTSSTSAPTTTGSKTTEGTSTATGSSSATATSVPSMTSSGLSTGAKAGIGVGVGVAALALVAVFFAYRSCKSQRQSQHQYQPYPQATDGSPPLPPYYSGQAEAKDTPRMEYYKPEEPQFQQQQEQQQQQYVYATQTPQSYTYQSSHDSYAPRAEMAIHGQEVRAEMQG